MLADGRVLVAGGYNNDTAELYDPASGTWTTTGSLHTAREYHTATLLPNGMVLVTGGWYAWPSIALSSAELYDPASGTWTPANALNTAARCEHTATLLPNGKVVVAGGRGNSGAWASAELYDAASGTWTATCSLNTGRIQHAATLLPNGRVLVAGGYYYNGSDWATLSSAEFYDPASGIWTTTDSLNNARGSHTMTLLPSGKVLVAGGVGSSGTLASAELFDLASGTWTTTGLLNTARNWHTATLLPNGHVLVTAGEGSGYISLASAELYDPANRGWTTTGLLNTARAYHTATLLGNGQVLVAGGHYNDSLASAELFDPATGKWRATTSLNDTRYEHTATLLPNGQVLVAGGFGNSGWLRDAELYDPASGTWTVTGWMITAREYHTATLLPNGQVLVAGGYMGSGIDLSSSELYNPASGTWTTTGSLNDLRINHTATLLPSGKVLVAGGAYYNGSSWVYPSSAELYDPASGTWNRTGSLTIGRRWHTATLLPNGQVLVAGGEDINSNPLSSAELYDPASGRWTTTGPLRTARESHTATLLANGRVLLAGGWNSSSGDLASAELYDVGLGFDASWQPQITTFTSPLATNGCLTLTGSGFRGVSEGSGGNGSQDSPADYPAVQLRRLDNEQTLRLLSTNWSTNSFISAPVSGLAPGWAMATVFVNGIPSKSSLLRLDAVAMPPICLTNAAKLSGGSCQFCFANTPGLGFTILAATNPALPLSSWTVLGCAAEVAPGQFQFTDSQATNSPRRFYRVRSP